MSKAWGKCVGCGEWTLHYIRTVRPFQDVTKDQMQVTGMWDGDTTVKWVPGKRITGRRMLRECNACGLQWWETLEQKIMTDEERWPQ